MSHLLVKSLTSRIKTKNHIYTVVDNLSFELKEGKTLALVGESGCGKSVTALSILRILQTPLFLPPTGEVLFQGENLLTLSEKRMRAIRGKEIAMIFQDPAMALNPVYTIGEQIKEAALLHFDITDEEAENKAILAISQVGIPSPEERFFDYPHQLSGGMKQRVMIAMALVCEPKVLIADEPTTALDVTVQAQNLDLMRRLQQETGMAILLITHDMSVVAEMADDVIVMYAAQAIETGTSEEIFDHMAHPYTQGLFRSQPSYAHLGSRLETIKGSVPSLGHYPKACRFHPRCPFVMPKCLVGEVPDFKTNSTHTVKCWLSEHAATS